MKNVGIIGVGKIGKTIEPVIEPLGFDWKIGIALITSFAAREVVVSTLSTIYNRFSLELRYPITLKPAASIIGLTFLETGQGYNSFREFNPFNGKR